MSKTIPEIGEMMNPYPGAVHVSHISYGPDTTYDVQFTDSTAAVKLWDIQAGVEVLVDKMCVLVGTASTALEATIGDTDVDGFFTDTVWIPKTAGGAFIECTGAHAPGRHYSSSDAINCTITTACTGDGVGNFYLFYTYAELDT